MPGDDDNPCCQERGVGLHNERLVRRGVDRGRLKLNYVIIGGGFDGVNPNTLMNFIRHVLDGAVLTPETSMPHVLPINMMAIAMVLHVRRATEDNIIWTQDQESMMSQVEQSVAFPTYSAVKSVTAAYKLPLTAMLQSFVLRHSGHSCVSCTQGTDFQGRTAAFGEN